MLLKFRILLLILAIPLISVAQLNVVKVGQDFNMGNKEGIFYSLPKIGVKIDFSVEKTSNIKGPFSSYASKYLGIDKVIESNTAYYSIKEIELSTYILPDPDYLYFIEYDSKEARGEEGLELYFSRNGYFTGCEALNGDKSKNILSITNDHYISENKHFGDLPVDNLYTKIDTIVKMITIDTITIKQYSYKSSRVLKSTVQKVEEIVALIKSLRDNQYNLLIGYQEVPYSKESLEFMYNKLQNMETAYLDMFRGKTIYETYSHSVLFVPGSEDYNKWIPVSRFSEIDGMQELSVSDQEAIYVRFDVSGNTTMIAQKFNESTPDEDKEGNGFYCRIPEFTTISLRYKEQFDEALQLMIPQFGTVVQLPHGAKDMNLHPWTGNMRKVVLK